MDYNPTSRDLKQTVYIAQIILVIT